MVSQQLSTNRVLRHKVNPYGSAKSAKQATLFRADEYYLTVLLALSARALRVLTILAAKVDGTGVSRCTKQEIQDLFTMQRPNITHSVRELIDANLIQKGKHLDTYYLNPKVFQSVNLITH